MPLALTDETKERISKLVEMGRVTLQYGWLPFIVYVGWTNSSPRPSLIHRSLLLFTSYSLPAALRSVCLSDTMDVVAGLCAGAASTLVTHPLDLLKTRQQLGKPTSGLSLYRGLAPNLVGNVTAWGSYYGLYNSFQRHLAGTFDGPLLYWASSLGAGVLTSFLTSPLWVVKTRMLGSTGDLYRRMPNTIRYIASTNGIKGFWRGFPISLAGNFQASIHFMVYDTLKPLLLDGWHPTLKYMAASAISKALAATIMYPYQVIRAQMQYSDSRFLPTIKTVYGTQGPRGFYKGLGFALLRVVPAMCITQVCYESISALGKEN